MYGLWTLDFVSVHPKLFQDVWQAMLWSFMVTIISISDILGITENCPVVRCPFSFLFMSWWQEVQLTMLYFISLNQSHIRFTK